MLAKMFSISTKLSILSDRLFLLLLFLLLPFLFQHPFAAEAGESIDSTCKSSNEYLAAMYRCRETDFKVISFCANQSPHELTCARSNRMAIFNSSIGRRDDRMCSQTDTPLSSRNSFEPSNAASECCLLPTVESKCHGKVKCSLNVVELLHSTDGVLCSPENRDVPQPQQPQQPQQQPQQPQQPQQQPQQRIMVVFICVSQRTFKELNRDRISPDSFCDGHTDPNDDHSTDGLRRKPVDAVRLEENPVTTIRTQPHPLPPTESSELTSEDRAEQSDSTDVYGGEGSLDWMWSMIFIKENMDRFLIYLFLSIAVGVILVLLVVVLSLCFGRYWRKRNSKETKGPGHMTQSSTQTNDVTTSFIASNYTPGIEMVHFAQTDSLHTLPVARSNGNPSLTGNSVRFAPDGSTEKGIRRTENGGSSYLNVPHYQINSSTDSMDGGDRVDRLTDHEDYRSNTLGRFYSNPYRHDSYRADGYRTLQLK